MFKMKMVVFLFAAIVFESQNVLAETILFKSGKSIEGKIIEQTNADVKVEFYGNVITLSKEQIESISQSNSVSKEGGKSPAAVQGNQAFSTAVITYQYTGFLSGHETAYIDKAKNKFFFESSTTTTIMDKEISKHTGTLYDGEDLYGLDYKRNMATKMPFDLKTDIITDFFGETFLSKYSKGTVIFLGKECNVYETPTAKLYFWNGLELRKETQNPMGEKFNRLKEATNIEIDPPISEDKFRLPPGFQVSTTEEAMQDIEKMFKTLQSDSGNDNENEKTMKALKTFSETLKPGTEVTGNNVKE